MKENVVIGVRHAVLLAKFWVGDVLSFTDMDGRLTPVGGAPCDIYSRAVGIVGQQFIEVVAVLGFQDGFRACSGVSGA